MERRSNPGLPERIASLESAVRRLHEDLQELQPKLGQIVTIFLSFVAVAVVIIGMVGKIAIFDPYTKLEQRVDGLSAYAERTRDKVVEHISADAKDDTRVSKDVEDLTRRVKKIEDYHARVNIGSTPLDAQRK